MRELHAPRAPRQKFASSLAILFLPSHSSSRFTKESNFSIFCDQRPSQKKGEKKESSGSNPITYPNLIAPELQATKGRHVLEPGNVSDLVLDEIHRPQGPKIIEGFRHCLEEI